MPRSDSASAVVAAPVSAVFDALIDPAALVIWLPPDGMSGVIEAFDARPGGSYRMVLSYDPPAQNIGKTTDVSDVIDAQFVEIVPGERVVYDARFASPDEAFAGTMRMTWALSPQGQRTLVEVRADGVPDVIPAGDHQVGMQSSLDNLDAYLTG
jgi:uncharacterized protein YndB with AHSA1/START domain